MRPDDLDALIAERIDLRGPGVAVAIVRDGEVVYERGHGLANLEWNSPVAPDAVLKLEGI